MGRPSAPPLIFLIACLLVAAVGPNPASARTTVQSAAKPKPCKASEVKRTVTYRLRGRRQSATACVPRSWTTKPTLREARAILLKLAPKRIATLLRGAPARRVSAADPVLDRAITGAQLPPLIAAAIGQGNDTQTLKGPPGTTTVQTRTGTEWDASEPNPGTQAEVVVETKGKGSSKKTTYTLLRTMSRCPDPGGIGRGAIKLTIRETRVMDEPGGGHGVTDTLNTYTADVLVHFNDGAAVESVEVVGNWTYSNETRIAPSRGAKETRLTRHTADGAVGGSTKADGSGSTVGTTVKNASNAGMAIYGLLAGAISNSIVDEVPGQLVRESAGRAQSGACAKIVPDPPTVHVKPGQSVELTATLNDGAGAPLPGTVRAVAAQATVTPGDAQADPAARFTYNALSYSPPGKTDTVTFNHVSRRGLANAKTVTVIYDDPPGFPKRFDGTWTRIETDGYGLIQTFHGTAAYVKNVYFGPEYPGTEDAAVPYDVESASVDWSVSGSSSSGGCTSTYSGSGHEVYSPESWTGASSGGTHLSLQDLRRGAGAPASEPQPYNYAIQATGDPDDRVTYSIDRSGTCSGHSTGDLDYHYLDIGTPTYEMENPPPSDEVERTNDPMLLEGHRFKADPTGPNFDDTWRFTGSG
jgi:hypothetical protein